MLGFTEIQSTEGIKQFLVEEKVLVLFVHGLGGQNETWRKFVQLVQNSRDMAELFDFDYYTYPTGIVKFPWEDYPPIKTISDGLRTAIRNKWYNFNHIILVCHSMGGLVARKFILDQVKGGNEEDIKVRNVLFYATPHLGAQLASLTWRFHPWHSQLMQLSQGSEFVEELNNDWSHFGVSSHIDPVYIVGGIDSVVPKASAQHIYGSSAVEVIPSCGHFNIIRPEKESDMSFLIFKKIILKFMNKLIDDNERKESDEQQEDINETYDEE